MSRIRRLTWLALLALGTLNLSAATVLFTVSDFLAGAPTNVVVTVFPLSTPALNGTTIIVNERYKLTNSTGSFGLTNMVAGNYRVEMKGLTAQSTITLSVPDTNAVLDASALTSLLPATGQGGNFGVFGGATALAAGTKGLVPAPAAGEQTEYLRGDGTWAAVAGGTASNVINVAAGTNVTAVTNGAGLLVTISAPRSQPAHENLTNWSALNTNIGAQYVQRLAGGATNLTVAGPLVLKSNVWVERAGDSRRGAGSIDLQTKLSAGAVWDISRQVARADFSVLLGGMGNGVESEWSFIGPANESRIETNGYQNVIFTGEDVRIGAGSTYSIIGSGMDALHVGSNDYSSILTGNTIILGDSESAKWDYCSVLGGWGIETYGSGAYGLIFGHGLYAYSGSDFTLLGSDNTLMNGTNAHIFGGSGNQTTTHDTWLFGNGLSNGVPGSITFGFDAPSLTVLTNAVRTHGSNWFGSNVTFARGIRGTNGLGTAGQVWTTDGASNYWSTVSGVGGGDMTKAAYATASNSAVDMALGWAGSNALAVSSLRSTNGNGYELTLSADDPEATPLRLVGTIGQYNHLLTFLRSNDTVLAAIGSNGMFHGDGAGLTNLNGSSLASGTVAEARIHADIARDSEVTSATQNATNGVASWPPKFIPGTGFGAVTNSGVVTAWYTNNWPIVPTRLVFEGDSLSVTASNSYALWLTNLFFTNANFVWGTNAAWAGESAATMVGQYTNQVRPYAPAGGTNAVLFLWAGINDLVTDGHGTVFNNLSNLWRMAKQDGFEVVAFTVTPTLSGSIDLITVESNRNILNGRIRDAGTQWTYLVDADAVLPSVHSSAYISDWVHWKTNAQAYLARAVDHVVRQTRGAGSQIPAMDLGEPKTFGLTMFNGQIMLTNNSSTMTANLHRNLYCLEKLISPGPYWHLENRDGSSTVLGTTSAGFDVYHKGIAGDFGSSDLKLKLTETALKVWPGITAQGSLGLAGPLWASNLTASQVLVSDANKAITNAGIAIGDLATDTEVLNATNLVAAWTSNAASMNATSAVASWATMTASQNATNNTKIARTDFDNYMTGSNHFVGPRIYVMNGATTNALWHTNTIDMAVDSQLLLVTGTVGFLYCSNTVSGQLRKSAVLVVGHASTPYNLTVPAWWKTTDGQRTWSVTNAINGILYVETWGNLYTNASWTPLW